LLGSLAFYSQTPRTVVLTSSAARRTGSCPHTCLPANGAWRATALHTAWPSAVACGRFCHAISLLTRARCAAVLPGLFLFWIGGSAQAKKKSGINK